VLILRLKRCERALAGGRLDEAVQLLLPADARAHRRGQELLDRLVNALVERGRVHLAEGRLAAAEADWHAAASVAGNMPKVAQLRTSLDQAVADQHRVSDERRRAKGTVEALVRQGQFTLAEGAAVGAGAMVADIAVVRAASARLASDVREALREGDWETAAQRIAAARGTPGADGNVQQLKREVAACVAVEARGLIDGGRLDEAASVLRRAGSLGAGLGEIDAVRRCLEQCQMAWALVRGARYQEAREILERLKTAWPGARWIATACEEMRVACGAIDAVRGGTLGMLEVGDKTVAFPAMVAAIGGAGGGNGARVNALPAVVAATPARPSARRFLLHVDGAGSYLVLQGNTFEVGPVSASRVVDLPLIVAAGSPMLTLSRSDDDYFLSASVALAVNERAVRSKLLASGDRIAVGPRGRVEFRRPNAASGTAVLRVSGARLPWGGVREVLLMDREIILGASTAAHVRVAECRAPVILQASGDGGILCRAEDTVMIDGQPSGRAANLRDGAQVVVGAASFVIRRE
jgi:hypothetical protein